MKKPFYFSDLNYVWGFTTFVLIMEKFIHIIHQNLTKIGEKANVVFKFELCLRIHHIHTDYGEVYLYNSPKLN